MIRVAIATSSQQKIIGIKKGFSRFLGIEESKIEIYSKPTETGVSEQPFNWQTYEGATNRVNNIRKYVNEDYDYYVSCEAGIEGYGELYFNVQIVCIYEFKSQRYLYGKSSGWQIPSKDIEMLKNNTIDTYLKEKGFKSIEELVGINYPRSEFVAQATEQALASNKLL